MREKVSHVDFSPGLEQLETVENSHESIKSDELSINRLAENFEYGERKKNLNKAIEKQYNDILQDDFQRRFLDNVEEDFSGKKLK